MSASYYDVVVMGMELGPLTAGALLARRGFRVLVVGQKGAFDSYSCFGYSFLRRPFVLTASHSPVIRRVIEELTLGQLFQHVLHNPKINYQVVLKDARIDVYGDLKRTEKEIAREIPSAAQSAGAVLQEIGRLNGEFEKLLSNDLVIPPESFFERREFARAEVQNPFYMAPKTDVFKKLNISGTLRNFLEAPVKLETAGINPSGPLACVRQMGAWMFDCQNVQNGRDGLRKLLCDRIIGQGGDVLHSQSVTEILVGRGKVRAVRMEDREEPTSCQVVLTDLSPKELAPFIAPNLWPKRFVAQVEDATESRLAYGINLAVDSRVVPAAMAQTVIVFLGSGFGADLFRVELVKQKDPSKAVFHVSCNVAPNDNDAIVSGALRDALLDRMRWLVPFLDSHLKVVHSCYDGFGSMDLTGEAKGDAPAAPRPEEVPKWLVQQPLSSSALGVENMPHRTGIKGLLLAGSQVVSGISTEGEMLAAWGAARIAGKMDPGRQRLVRSMRAKIEN